VGLVPIKKSIVADLRFGYTTNLGIIKAPSGSLALAYRISIGDNYALVGANATLYRSKSTESADDGSELELSVLGAPIVATLGYELVLRHFSAFVGGGGGFLGTRLPLGPGHMVAQASYWMAKINHEGVSGNLLGLAVDLGYGFDL
jgi:hypothetical protein